MMKDNVKIHKRLLKLPCLTQKAKTPTHLDGLSVCTGVSYRTPPLRLRMAGPLVRMESEYVQRDVDTMSVIVQIHGILNPPPHSTTHNGAPQTRRFGWYETGRVP